MVNFIEDWKILRNWCQQNKMQVNMSKTKFINVFVWILILTNLFSFISKLGLFLDNKLTWENLNLTLNIKINSTISFFYYVRNVCDTNVIRTLYFLLVQSRLQYAINSWGNINIPLIKLLDNPNHLPVLH